MLLSTKGDTLMGKEELDLSQWYTAQEAAEKLGTTPKYIRTLGVQYKKFRTYKLHDHLMLYWKADVDAYQVEKGRPGRRSSEEAKEEVLV
jgi:hypothetical protein